MTEKMAKITETIPETATGPNIEAYFKEQVRQPGLFFCIHNAEQWPLAEKFIRKGLSDFPQLKALIYITQGKMEPKPAAAHFYIADKTDFNLFGKEKPALKRWIAQHPFDLLLVFSKKENKRCRKLGISLKARLKAGMAGKDEKPWTDLNLGIPEGEWDYDGFYKAVKTYFKQLNIKLSS